MKTWILVANSSDAKLLTTDNLRVGRLEPIREFTHPDSRKKVADLITDRPGSYRTDTEGHGSFINKGDPKGMEADHFAVELIKELKLGYDQGQYKKLIIVASDSFYGLMKKHMYSKHMRPPEDLEITHIAKDYTKCDPVELHSRLKDHIFI